MPEHSNSMQDTQMHLWHNYSNLLLCTCVLLVRSYRIED